MKHISFYKDTSKQKEFLDRLESILKTPNELECCQLTMMVSNNVALAFIPQNKKAKKVYFYFTNNDQYIENKAIKELGFTEENTTKLINLFNDFNITNHAEANFFISQFFLPSFKHNLMKNVEDEFDMPVFHTPIFYFNPEKNENLFLIEDKKMRRFFSPIYRKNLEVIVKELEPGLNSDSSYIKINSFGFKEYNSLDEAKKNLTNQSEQVVAEIFQDLENIKSYMHTIHQFEDEHTHSDSVPFMKNVLGMSGKANTKKLR